MNLKSRLTWVLLACATMATACMWDSDTLAEEVKGNKVKTLEVIIGAFDRNPPLYYRMRLDRIAREVAAMPTNLGLYDDAGVASDRLGKHDAAIAWMAKKEAAMKLGKPTADDRYRYHANLGTFHAHRWFATRAHFDHLNDLDQGIRHIRKAIEINPKAHFGREKFQLAILEWVKTKPKADADSGREIPLVVFLEEGGLMGYRDSAEAIEGLSGLIRLGNAWESVDVFAALGQALAYNKDGVTGETAIARVEELTGQGKKSISGWVMDKDFFLTAGPDPAAKANARAEFSRLRKEADLRHEKRTEFMMAKLKSGRHPDTDPSFWAGYVESKIEVKDLLFFQKSSFKMWAMVSAVIGTLIAIPVVIAVIIVKFIKRRRLAALKG